MPKQAKIRANVIDLSERRANTVEKSQGLEQRLRLRLDMEQAKIAISTSLISIVVLTATVANKSLWSTGSEQARGTASESSALADGSSRNIASLAAASVPEGEVSLAHRLAVDGLASDTSFGRQPSTLDQLALGFLEGKYALFLEGGKIHGLQFNSQADAGDAPKFVDRIRFLEQNRSLLPVAFDRLARSASDEPGLEAYELLRNGVEAPLAKVEFRMDEAGRMLSMKVHIRRVALNN
jgi:hypothetical protein